MPEQVSEPAHDGQAQAETFLAPSGCLALVELLEDILDLIGLDTDAGIGDSYMTTAVYLVAHHADVTGIRVTNRV